MDFSILCSLYPLVGIGLIIFGIIAFSFSSRIIALLLILAGIIILGVWFFNLLSSLVNAITNPLGFPWWYVEAV